MVLEEQKFYLPAKSLLFIFNWVLGIEIRSPGLCGKHFYCWAILLALHAYLISLDSQCCVNLLTEQWPLTGKVWEPAVGLGCPGVSLGTDENLLCRPQELSLAAGSTWASVDRILPQQKVAGCLGDRSSLGADYTGCPGKRPQWVRLAVTSCQATSVSADPELRTTFWSLPHLRCALPA